MDLAPNLQPDTARKIFLWQMIFFAVLLIMSDMVNALSTNTDIVRIGMQVEIWKPIVWEFSSGFAIWVLIPLLHQWHRLFSLTRPGRWRGLPAHLMMTAPV